MTGASLVDTRTATDRSVQEASAVRACDVCGASSSGAGACWLYACVLRVALVAHGACEVAGSVVPRAVFARPVITQRRHGTHPGSGELLRVMTAECSELAAQTTSLLQER